jgi:uncharacterized membrane protein YfcA
MTLLPAAIPVLAAALGGALNAVAGGGLFLAFPALILTGMAPIPANATSTVALWPGSLLSIGAYRRELVAQRNAIALAGVSVVGSVAGAVVLLRTPQSTFAGLLPWLMLGATLLFSAGRSMNALLRLPPRGSIDLSPSALAGVLTAQFVIALYGGFFGGGIGIMMLALFSLFGMQDMHRMNALKTLLVACINGAAVVMFAAGGLVRWPSAIMMTAGATLGGYVGAAYGRRLNPKLLRAFVTGVGSAMTAYFFYRTYGAP